MLAYYEVIHWCLVSLAILYNVGLKVDLLAGRVFHKRDLNINHLVCDEGAVGSAPRLRDNLLCNRNVFWKCVYLTLFFIRRRSPLDPESSRTAIVLFLTFSPELTPGSGFLAQSECVLLLFGFKLVLFSSNFFDLDANFFGNRPFLVFGEGFLNPREFSSRNWHFLPFFGKKVSCPWT